MMSSEVASREGEDANASRRLRGPSEPAVRKAPVVVVFLTVFIDLLGFGMIVPLLTIYARSFDATPFQAGLLVASYSLAQFVFAPIWGHVSDRVGRKPILTLTLAGNALAYTVYAFSRDLTMLFVSRSLSGVFAANISTAQAYVADVTTPENRAKGMGMIGMAFGLGFVLGPAIGGPLGYHVGVWAPGAAAAVLSAIACVLCVVRLDESLTPALRANAQRRAGHPIFALRTALGRKEIAGLLAFFFFLTFGFANLESMAPIFLQDRFGFNEAETGYVFAFIGVCISFAQGFLIGRLSRKYGEANLLRVAPWLIVIGFQLYWLAPNLWVYLVFVPFVAIGMGLSNPSVATLISRRTPPDVQGRTLGLSQSLGALARAISPALAGWLYGRFPTPGIGRALYSRTPAPGLSVIPLLWGGIVIALGIFLVRPCLRLGVPSPAPAARNDLPPPAEI
jgi:DHA1 family tetracycline resistance protein-like MFS transporter